VFSVHSKLTDGSGSEQNRLELQAQALEQLMSNNIFHSPLVKPNRVLDIGCGTGRSTVQLAQRFPDARIIGVDLSPVPAVHPKPDNVEYIQADIRQLMKSDDERFANGSFDYVFSRLLSLGMTDWQGYVSEVSSILAPGGWFEVQEFEIGHHDADGTVITDEIPAMKVFYELLSMEPLPSADSMQYLANICLRP
jgi:ubiquinone/menaquinone biosynthesis C-methylase UbiE